jgi:CubicO group peptidase (beta-lactamase class C family)
MPHRVVSTRPFALATVLAGTLALSTCGNPLGPADRDDIAAWMAYYDVPGVSVAVITDFALDYVEVHGVKDRTTQEPVTAQTLFQAASLTKGVSAMGVVRLMQEGVVSLDRDVNDYLTSWRVPDNAFQATEKVTLRRLLSHTAGTTVHGFRGYRYTESVPTLVQILNGTPPANSPPVVLEAVPGTRFQYSGGGYEIADQVVRDVTGGGFPEFMKSRVLDPVGMAHSTFEQPLPATWFDSAASGYYADGTPVPGRHHIYPEFAAAALWTTPSDYAHLLIEIQWSLRGESNRVLSRENAALLVTEVQSDYGLGFGLRLLHGQPYFWHDGANDGFRGAMVAHLSRGHGVVVMTNSDNGLELAEAVIELIGRREKWPGY